MSIFEGTVFGVGSKGNPEGTTKHSGFCMVVVGKHCTLLLIVVEWESPLDFFVCFFSPSNVNQVSNVKTAPSGPALPGAGALGSGVPGVPGGAGAPRAVNRDARGGEGRARLAGGGARMGAHAAGGGAAYGAVGQGAGGRMPVDLNARENHHVFFLCFFVLFFFNLEAKALVACCAGCS